MTAALSPANAITSTFLELHMASNPMQSLRERLEASGQVWSFLELPDHLQLPDMASRKRSDPDTAKDRPARTCIVCTEEESGEFPLYQPCRSCSSDYCVDCLVGMFLDAINDNTRMPPRCCNLIQIHTVLDHGVHRLEPPQAKAYREKFDEWITPTKTYCPFPKCSAFIPDRKLPRNSSVSANKQQVPSLQTVLTGILDELTRSWQARFFREPVDPAKFPVYEKVIENPIDLDVIQKRLETSYYKATSDLTKDIRLIVFNAKKYNGEKHPVARAAEELFSRYLDEISKATDRLISSFPATRIEEIFACPKCYGAICVSCKQIAHLGDPCDTSKQDHELAMLEQYGYKRCPRCKAGVKKMYGCSHMQCVCGAHWCYYCQKPIQECDGACAAAANEMESEEDYDSDEDGSQLSEEENIENQPPQRAVFSAPDGPARASSAQVFQFHRRNPGDPGASLLNLAIAPPIGGPPSNATSNPPISQNGNMAISAANTAPNSRSQNPPAVQIGNIPVNLDAGGPRRWADADFDFGEEPEEGAIAQVWSCKHAFDLYKAASDDGIKRGNLDEMECNRCFIHVVPTKAEIKPPSQPTKKRKKNSQSQGSKIDPILIKEDSPSTVVEVNMAHECTKCKLVVCANCKDMYKTE